MADHPIFFDPRGRRARIASYVAGVVAAVVVAIAVVILITGIFVAPQLPTFKVNHRWTTYQDPLTVGQNGTTILAPKLRRLLEADLQKKGMRAAGKKPQDTIVLGYYAPYQSSGLESLEAHASALTHLAPEWLHLGADGRSIDYRRDYDPTINPSNAKVERLAKESGLRIVPILDDFGVSQFEEKRAAPLLRDAALQKKIATELAGFLTKHGYDGIHLDLEELTGEDSAGLVRFAKVLRETFAPKHLSVSAAVEPENDELDFAALAESCDFIVPMLYDEHSEDGPAGPIASLDWGEDALERILKTVPESKVVMGVGNFGYDWLEGSRHAENLTFQGAMTTASGYRDEDPSKVLRFDTASSNTTFAYRDDDDRLHRVWYLDAISAYNQLRAAEDTGIRGGALWMLGSEDPGVWSFFDRRRLFKKVDPAALSDIHFSYEVSFEGRGEILGVKSWPKDGERTVTLDEDGLVDSCRTERYASPFVVAKSGYVPKKIALTFDDGPDREWTPKVLDVLKRYGVPGTFFCIGANVETMPDLVAREYAEGHEIGNHSFTHPDLGTASEKRAKLEINLTQMAIEGATDHSSALFRPPYNADSEPETPDQLNPVLDADRLGYVTVGENVDPLDWNPVVTLPSGATRPRTAADIAGFVISDLKRREGTGDEGNIVLLHDAGGDRSETIKALPTIITRLRQQGYEFVPVSRLVGKTRDGVMPAVSGRDRFYYTLGRWVLGSAFRGLGLLAVAFTVAIVIGLARTALIMPLALWNRRRTVPGSPSDLPVSVVIAAYNEAAVIESTVHSVLNSEAAILEIIVVDDGSSDGTAEIVRNRFANEPRVRVISKPNGGKASALNEGIREARGELLFHIDADTVLDPRAIGLLTRHFTDTRVAAVAGDVQVGNRINLLTRWQDLEYITSQNLDRRAYAQLNCITVVPGAIGMWRKDAVLAVGGYQTDTLAEDMDLTWRLRQAGYRLDNEPQAHAYTEAPERFGPFLKQRFRWSYGTLQCLFKHWRALGRFGWFGCLALPTQWLFGVVFQALAPLIDLQILVSGVGFLLTLQGPDSENRTEAISHWQGDFMRYLLMYALFLTVEAIGAGVALRMEGKPLRRLWPLLLQRFVYRQMMYAVMYKSLVRAIAGSAAGWGKLARTGSVKTPLSEEKAV